VSTLRILAEEIEETGELTEGRVTENMPFLAKITILEEEYPDFYDTLSENPRLLGKINAYFRGQLGDSDENRHIETILDSKENSATSDEQESRLEAFLRSTRHIHVENPNPFLHLSEPSYATSLTDVNAYLQNLRTGQKEEVREELEKVDNHEPYVDAVENAFAEYTKKKREQPLFGTIDTVLTVFDTFAKPSQERLILLLSDYLTVDPGRSFLVDLDPETIFPIILQMPDNELRTLLTEYANLIIDGQHLRENILQAFVDISERQRTQNRP
ncbi:MAG: KAP P-loop domain protein, partial [Candidatus Paceibacteria bacterium]